MLQIIEDESTKYAPRTFANARDAALTIAFALEFSTAGETLTKKAAGDLYFPVHLGEEMVAAARRCYPVAKALEERSFNIAGNGIYTLARKGWEQERINLYVFQFLMPLHEHLGIKRVVCGGQSGVDLAGAVAAYKLQVPAIVRMPRGCLQRNAEGVDNTYRPEVIREMIVQFASQLEA